MLGDNDPNETRLSVLVAEENSQRYPLQLVSPEEDKDEGDIEGESERRSISWLLTE
jgi:hypothetical protein